MIKTLSVDFRNCYGIGSLVHNFNFNNGVKAQLIYAPNGSMKTSFAKTMRFLSKQSKEEPKDQIDTSKSPEFSLLADGKETLPDNIFVVNGDDEIDSSKAFINFLASADLKKRYEKIYSSLIEVKEPLISKLKTTSQSSDCEEEILSTFASSENDSIFEVLANLNTKEIEGRQEYKFRYNDIFDKKGKVEEFLKTHKDVLEEYIKNYNQLLSESTFYRSIEGHSFGTFQAEQLSNTLKDGNFFEVKHKLILQDGNEISSQEELTQKIESEKQRILTDKALKKTFEKITKAIDKNVELRNFKTTIEQHPDWIVELVEFQSFKEKVWYGFLANSQVLPLLVSYQQVYGQIKDNLKQVLEEASKQQDNWRDIIDLYNARFHVPIKVEIENQRDIILRQEAAKLSFQYVQDGRECPINDKNKLLDKILSRGEKRAFVILQFIFEMEARKTLDQDTLVIMDDIADSFDYQNKYAIIEYIKDLSENGKIYLLIMTHNYDFYRTVSSRLLIDRKNLWMVEKEKDNTIKLFSGQYTGNVFDKVFIGHDKDDKFFISMIPFIRNLIEYTKGKQSEEYAILTACLHRKENSKEITEKQLIDIFRGYTQGKGIKREATERKIYELIINTANGIVNEINPDPIHIENKIVLSIAIRLRAEEYMYDKLIQLVEKPEDIKVKGNQTGKWIDIYKKEARQDKNMGIIERVSMMTPEAIHINSFMFEPLIDMSLQHLLSLYNDCVEHLK